MFLKVVFSSIFLVITQSFAITIEPPPDEKALPNPSEVERQRIEKKYDATAPKLEKAIPTQQEKEKEIGQNKPIIIRNYEIKKEELSVPNPVIVQGTRIERKQKHDEATEGKVENREKADVKKISSEYVYTGYCNLNKDVVLSIEDYTLESDCLIDKKIVKAEITLIPVIAEYKVIGVVNSLGGKKVEKSTVRTDDRRTDNLADDIDRRMISNILLISASETGKQTSDMVSSIMKNAAKVNNTSSFGYSTTTIDPTQALSKIPKASLYLAIANLTKSSADELLTDKKKLPPIFTVKKKDVYIQAWVVEDR